MIDNLREQIKNIKLLGGKSKFQFSLYYLLIFEEIDRGPLLISDALTFDASSTQWRRMRNLDMFVSSFNVLRDSIANIIYVYTYTYTYYYLRGFSYLDFLFFSSKMPTHLYV